jgi:hypothetical protein
MIKQGSKWEGSDGKVFVVISTTVIEGKDWVYYRAEKLQDHMPTEFSCYEESFLARFRERPE